MKKICLVIAWLLSIATTTSAQNVFLHADTVGSNFITVKGNLSGYISHDSSLYEFSHYGTMQTTVFYGKHPLSELLAPDSTYSYTFHGLQPNCGYLIYLNIFTSDSVWYTGFSEDTGTLPDSQYFAITEHDVKTFSLYPNPVQNFMNVAHKGGDGILKITNATGHEVMQKKLSGSNSTIDLSHLPTGIYVVKISHSNGAYSYKKILKE